MRQRRWIELISDYDCEIHYHPGKANVVAEALSKKSHLKVLKVGNPPLVDRLEDRVRNAQHEALSEQGMPKEVGKVLDYEGKDILYFKGHMWIPPRGDLRDLLLEESHKTRFSIHPSAKKMYKDMKHNFWWPGMKRDIATYVARCTTCARVKAKHQRPSGLLVQSPIPEWKWDGIAMDFITKLPRTSKGYDSIWVVIDRLTKSTHFIPIREDYKVKKLAQIYIDEIVRLHGIPTYIISDRDSRFLSRIWQSIQESLGTRLDISTTLYPQTDGQSERTIQTLEDMLRACIIDFGGNWDKYLPLAGFSYNNSYHSSIKMPPFECLYGRKYRSPISWHEVGESHVLRTIDPTITTGPELIQETTDKIAQIQKNLLAARSRQKRYADSKRGPRSFSVDDFVWLKVLPWKGVVHFGKKGKLAPRYVGPFKVLQRIGPVAYKLELPQELSRVHPVFHVANLKHSLEKGTLPIPLDDIQIDEDIQFVEKPLEIINREEKQLKRSRINLVKVKW